MRAIKLNLVSDYSLIKSLFYLLPLSILLFGCDGPGDEVYNCNLFPVTEVITLENGKSVTRFFGARSNYIAFRGAFRVTKYHVVHPDGAIHPPRLVSADQLERALSGLGGQSPETTTAAVCRRLGNKGVIVYRDR